MGDETFKERYLSGEIPFEEIDRYVSLPSALIPFLFPARVVPDLYRPGTQDTSYVESQVCRPASYNIGLPALQR